MQAMGSTVVSTMESNRNADARRKIDIGTNLEASLISSFETVLPGIMVGNTKDLSGGTFECLHSYLKTYSVWKGHGTRATSGLSHRLLKGASAVRDRLRALRNMSTTDAEVRELSLTLALDAGSFISEYIQWMTEQHDEMEHSSSLSSENAWSMQLEESGHMFDELYSVRAPMADAGLSDPGHYLWGLLRAHQIQERYRSNGFKDDPAFTGTLVRRILVHDGETALKEKLDLITSLQDEVDSSNKKFRDLLCEHNALGKRVKILEDKKK
mmetsp:Transcript_14468/g.20832  ORF Transcript_14468/g.20832 Transcript_14468/m.20832 type:complete len:269 (+) Transcript_14468:2224-3030(+)